MAKAADIYDIAAVVNLAFKAGHDFIAGERTSHGEILGLMKSSVFLVAIQDGQIVGTVQTQQNGTSGYFGMLAVDPRFQRRGIGVALREAVENHCRESGCKELTLTTASVRPELVQYYARSGYSVTNTESQPNDVQFKEKFYFIRMMKEL